MQNNKVPDEEKADPKENSRMVENSDREKEADGVDPQSSRLEDLSRRAKHFASNKYNVIIVLLCVLLLIFLFIIIGLGARLGSYTCPEPDVCRTPDCVKAASVVLARADATSEACSDFWSYSCNGWFMRNPLPSNKGSHSVLDELRNTVFHRIRHLIDLVPHFGRSLSSSSSSPELKVKNFYTACMNVDEIEYWVPLKFEQAIQEVGGWALVKRAPASPWRRNDVLKKLLVTYGVPVFFRVEVGPDDFNPARNIIKLVPDGLGLPGPKYYFQSHDDTLVKAYKEFIKNLVMVMSVDIHVANRFAEDMFHYEKRLAEITPEASVLKNDPKSYSVMTVAELDKFSTSITWSSLLQFYFPDVVRPDTHVAVLSEQYFSDISKLISATDTRTLNDYYMWRMLYTYVMHLSSKHRMVANQFFQAFEGVDDRDSTNKERWEFCVDLTNRFLGHAVGSMYMKQYVDAEAKKEVSMYIHKIIGAFSVLSRRLYWLSDSTSYDSALEKVLSAALILEYPGVPGFDSNCSLTEYYKEWVVQADYFQNIKEGLYFLRMKQSHMLFEGAFSSCSWLTPPHSVEAYYSYAGNRLAVPAGLLQEPLFSLSAPLAVKYGVLAGHVANKISAMFDTKGIHYDAFGTLQHWMSNFSMGTYQERLNCLFRESLNYTVHDITIEPNLTLSNIVADIGGVKLAYEAYLRHIKEVGQEKELPAMNLNNLQLFFVSYAQSLCEETRREKLIAYHDSRETLPGELRVTAVLQQLSEFSSAFGCRRGARMNSDRQCYMW